MKTHTKRLFAGLFIGAAAGLWVGHATDSPVNVDNSKVISTDHASITAVEATFISLNTTTAEFLRYEATGTGVNKVVSSLDAAPIFKEGGAALCAAMTPATQNSDINRASAFTAVIGTSTGAKGTLNNSPTAATVPTIAVVNVAQHFTAAGNEGVPAPEIA